MAPGLVDAFQAEVEPPPMSTTSVKTAAEETTTRGNTPYVIQDVPIGTRRPLRVVCMGAGYSGLLMAMIFRRQKQGKNADLVIYERNQDLGGTWLENR